MKKDKDINKEQESIDAQDVEQKEQNPGNEAAETAEDASKNVKDETPAKSEAETLKEQLDAANDKYLRLAAEFDNYRRRTAKERLELISSASEKVLKDILPIVDDFQRALNAMPNNEETKAVKEGTDLIYNKLVAMLKASGVSEVKAVGEEFNTEFHEAVAQFPAQDENQKNKIIDVVQAGYTLNGKVIRYAKVVVGV